MTRTNTSGSTCSWIVALLTLWSMVSVIVIVVWASWPPKASVDHCQAAYQALVEKMEGAKIVREKERKAMVREMEWSIHNQSRLRQALDKILHTLQQTNISLMDSLHEQATLKENLTARNNEVSVYKSEKERLSFEHVLYDAHIQTLQGNLTSEQHHLNSCSALNDATRSQQMAAESLTKACESRTKYLHKRLENCEPEE